MTKLQVGNVLENIFVQIENSSCRMVHEWVRKLKLYQYVVSESSVTEWSGSVNDWIKHEDMHFENYKKTTYPIMT